MKLTDDEIKRICSPTIYRRGCEYFTEGRVHIRVRDEHELVAAIDGEDLYNVRVEFSDEGKITETLCTCPYYQTMNAPCKHIVAALKLRKQELDEGDSFENDNDRIAAMLCSEFSGDESVKQRLSMQITVKINSKPDRSCRYSAELAVGQIEDGKTEPLKSVEGFLEAYTGGKEYKLSKFRTYTRGKYEFSVNDTRLLDVLAESYQNRAGAGLYYTPKITQTEFGPFTAKRLLPLTKYCSCEFVINEMHLTELRMLEEDPDIIVDVTATDDNINISVPESGIAIIPDGSWFFFGGDIYHTSHEWREWYMPIYRTLAVESRTQINFSGNAIMDFATMVFPKIKGKHGIVATGIDDAVIDEKPAFDVYLDRAGEAITAVIIASYGSASIRLPDESYKHKKIILRDFKRENEIMSYFSSFSVVDGTYYLYDEEETFRFIGSILPLVSGKATVRVSDAFNSLKHKGSLGIRGKVGYMQDVNLLEVSFESDVSQEEIIGILSAVRTNKKYYRMKDGSFLDLNESPDDIRLLDYIGFKESDVKNGRKKVSKYYALYLSGLAESGRLETENSFSKLMEAISEIEYTIPEYLEDTLRSYQKNAVKWLTQLDELGFGGILADDMGLGKTLEIIAFVVGKNPEKPTLVIAPSSLTYNWQKEIMRFAPDSTSVIIDGTREERIEKLKTVAEYDFVITSYPLLRRDIDEFSKLEFAYCVIDEAQYIKNPKTMNSRSVKKINAGRYFALTGTPIENSLKELWSIFDFIMHGYLGSLTSFSAMYEKPLFRDGDKGVIDDLRMRIKPFVLRRMKSEVLDELPEKIETVLYSELYPEQKGMYMSYLAVARNEAERIIKSGENKLQILTLLMRLRQICCHPALFDESFKKDSGKLDLLKELVETAISAGHRVLIFSQFAKMLKMIGKELEDMGVQYFYLDGNTKAKERTELADRFNRGEKAVFLVSLKAGGSGLNLIGADTVIHYDPWWNPAVTDQASDRSYRIGQTRSVQVIKLVAAGSIEEQILKLQDKKRELADGVITANSLMLSNLSSEEIMQMFS